MNSIPQKRCSSCKQYFPATREYFSTHRETRDKLEGICKSCRRAKQRERMVKPEVRKRVNQRERERLLANPERHEKKKQQQRERKRKLMADPEYRAKRNQQRRDQRANNPEYRGVDNQRQRERRQNNPALDERNRQNSRDWRKTEHGKSLMREAKRRRRAKRLGAEGTHTSKDIELQYRSQKGKCWHCGKNLNGKFEVDHLIPLDRGGTDWPSNLMCSCQKCNRSKGNKLPQEWNGRLF